MESKLLALIQLLLCSVLWNSLLVDEQYKKLLFLSEFRSLI